MNTNILGIVPVLPSANVDRDIEWYRQKTGFDCLYKTFLDDAGSTGYAVLGRDNQFVHLQWHAGTIDDPMPGGCVIRIFVKNILPLLEEFVARGTITMDKFKANTSWKTNEFGFYDLNMNAIFFVEDTDE